MFPFYIESSSRRIVNYLSFYLSHNSQHLYHSSTLLSHSSLEKVFEAKAGMEEMEEHEESVEHLFGKKLT